MKKAAHYLKTTVILSLIGVMFCLGMSSVSWAGAYFSDDMEGTAKWTGESPWSTTTSEYHSASTAWTDSPGAYYANEADISMILAASLDLSSATVTNPQLVFWHKRQIETDFDFGYLELSTDGGSTWHELASYTGISDWTREQIDISDYAGQANVLIRFRLETDKTIVWDGWYIDDVAISEPPNAVAELAVDNPTATTLDLAWTEYLSADFAGYKIYRSTTAGVGPSSTLVTTITDPNTILYTDTDLTPETTYYYKVYVFDTNDLAAGSKEESGITSIAEFHYPFFDDLEGSVGGWTAGSPWGLTDAHKHSGIYSWTDSPGGSYAAGADTSLQITVDLGAANMPVLTFWHKCTFDNNSDYGYIEVREDGTTTWKRLYFVTGTIASWTEERMDLSNYAGKKIDIRFRLVSDNDTQSDGWYIDDINIDETGTVAFTYPFIDDMEGVATSAANWHSSSWDLVVDGCSGSYAFTDSPEGDYGSLVSSELVMANSIDLNGALHPQLTFWHKYDTRNCPDSSSDGGCDYSQKDYDYARVYLSTYNGQPGTWKELAAFKGSQTTWEKKIIDLSTWAGLPNVRIKFVMIDTMDETINYRKPGWTIDDVAIEEAPVDVTLSITASSQNSVSIEWGENTDSDFARYELYRSSASGVTRSDTLVASITTKTELIYIDAVAMIQPGTYYYKMWVVDTDSNVSMGGNEVQATYSIPSNSFPFSEDGESESGTSQWSYGTPWGLTDTTPYEGTYCWTDSPGANYPANANTSLATFIDLSGTTAPVLTFWHRYFLEEGTDFVYLEVSADDGQTWTGLRTFTGIETAWNQERMNLAAYSGNANFGLRFRLTSDSANQQDGWYMDGLQIKEESIHASYPFFDDMESGIIPWFYHSTWGLMTLAAYDSHSDAASIVWTDSPEGSYSAGADTFLSMTIDLGSAVMPVLTFWQKYALESNSDHAYIEVREVGSATWERLYFATGTAAWFEERVDLSNYAGKQIELRFRLAADTNGTQSDGWYIDDINIDETETAVLTYPFTDDMEGGAATLANWHSSSWALAPDGYSGISGIYAFTDSPEGDYGSLVSSELIMANSIALSGAVHPQLTFWHKYDTRNCPDSSSDGGCDYSQKDYDYACVYLSTYNGQPGTWTQLASFKGDQTTWTYKQIDLSTWAGLPNVRIKFVMSDTMDETINYRKPGWTIDDVAIEEAPVDVTLSITASSQNSVSIEWGENTDSDFARYELYRSSASGVTRSDTLVASITTKTELIYIDAVAMIQPGTYYYKMWVVDTDSNVSMGGNEVQATYSIPSNSFPFSEDGESESGTSQWSYGTPWGLTDTMPYEGTYCWTDSPGANYPANANTSLATFIDLGGTTAPVLTFWHRYSLEDGIDFIKIEVSTDNGQTWTTIRSITGAESTWNHERISLTAYAGNANLGFRFRLTSNDTNQQDGWYMDGLQIKEESILALYPFFDDMESGSVPWFYDSPWGLITIGSAESHTGETSTVWTDSPQGSYSGGEDSSLNITVDLGAAVMPVLTFWQKYALESNSDHGYVEVREVGSSTWKRLYFITGTSAAWFKERIDLSGYAGKQVEIRFRLTSDTNGVQSDGWYIDDIMIAETEGSPFSYPFTDNMEGGAATLANWHSSSWALAPDGYSGISGIYAFTDSPEGDYGSLVSSELIMANSIALSGAVHPQLTFWHKYDTRNCPDSSSDGGCDYSQKDYDYACVYLSTYNGQPGTWTQLASFKGDQTTWTYKQIDLSTWAGLPNVRIKFVMSDTMDETINYRKPGWTIDDVRIGEDENIPSYIQKVSGDGQVGQTGTVMPDSFVARVYDSDSKTRSGILVNFVIESSDGSLSSETGISDANGLVSNTLTLGTTAGINIVSATIAETTESVTFSATGYAAGEAMKLSKVSGDKQVDNIDNLLPNSLVVKITDILGEPVSLTDVTFSVISGDGILANTDPVPTDDSGFASNTLTLGPDTGTTIVSASSAGLTGSPVSFTAYAVLSGGLLGDTDGDGMPDAWEDDHGLNSEDASDASLDTDSDGLTNLQEYTQGTDPNNSDSDNDGMPDGWETGFGLDPLYAGDAAQDNDGDGVANLDEYTDGTIPILTKHFQIAGATSESMDFYGNVNVDGVPAEAGDEVGVFDPDGVVCGQFTVNTAGQYGFMHVYRDDSGTTEVDEGAEPGNELTFRIWDAGAGVELDTTTTVITGSSPPSWTFDKDRFEVNLNGSGMQTIPLHEGWNLISFSVKTCYYADGVSGYADGPPAEPMLPGTVYTQVTSIADVFSSIAGLYDVVRSFDSIGAHTFDPVIPSYSDLKYVAGGYGYWIKMNTAGNLELNGLRALPADTLDLHTGWNLAGYWHPDIQYTGTKPLDVAFPPDATQFTEVNDMGDVLSAISGNYAVIRSYDSGAHTYDPMLGTFNDLEYFGPGYGMWIKMKTVDTLSY
ncbi:MAG: hypothetical protein SRB1_02516 [Desulfobacteraceae bacterium Eth-SRB1]|nr:MAG: hypothetical protein SRB1_02516 [Desulfobacteraceae bacterium Eth-SRB1]